MPRLGPARARVRRETKRREHVRERRVVELALRQRPAPPPQAQERLRHELRGRRGGGAERAAAAEVALRVFV